jgi:methenyltetrahydromethanopterin cyclohydrolase
VTTSRHLSRGARAAAAPLLADGGALRVRVTTLPCGARLVDCGVETPGSLGAGRRLAEVCLAGLVGVGLADAPLGDRLAPTVHVTADEPWAPCLASQYGGWKVAVGGFEAVGSGPARAVAALEPLFARLAYREPPQPTVLVLEADRLPGDEVARWVAERCRIAPADLLLLVAPTGSLAGTVQIAARSVETALHKLHHLGFDVRRVRRGSGRCPVAPPAAGFLEAFGRANDAILYGSEVELTVEGPDEELAALAPGLPASASRDYGTPCAELLRRTGGDLYTLDPGLFSPGLVTLVGAASGVRHRAGRLDADLLLRSFAGEGA